MSKFSPDSDITRILNFFQIHGHYEELYFFQIVASKPLYVKPCYNNFMSRNHFSKQGGPYYMNEGISTHDHKHKPGSSHKDIKPANKGLFIAIGFVTLLVVLSIVSIAL